MSLLQFNQSILHEMGTFPQVRYWGSPTKNPRRINYCFIFLRNVAIIASLLDIIGLRNHKTGHFILDINIVRNDYRLRSIIKNGKE